MKTARLSLTACRDRWLYDVAVWRISTFSYISLSSLTSSEMYDSVCLQYSSEQRWEVVCLRHSNHLIVTNIIVWCKGGVSPLSIKEGVPCWQMAGAQARWIWRSSQEVCTVLQSQHHPLLRSRSMGSSALIRSCVSSRNVCTLTHTEDNHGEWQ